MTKKQKILFVLSFAIVAEVTGQGFESWGWPLWVFLASGPCLFVIWTPFIVRAWGEEDESAEPVTETRPAELPPEVREDPMHLRATRVSSR